MPRKNTSKLHTIDARGREVGRLASEIARLLQGKNKVSWVPNRDSGDSVIIKNIQEAVFTGKKIKQKFYFHYSGYPGGIRKDPLEKLWNKNPADVFVKVVKQMLPNNTLRKKWLSRIKFANHKTVSRG
ncbi:50S ribosomal protein L13 [Candidatus Uhrbacteria bacterium RIFCSPLOWO2_12_FULL_46_10]|uniref:Large ribosomal subunit protein uL13 n=1 Tax=Candidatus Uhrbacteria bacterium RIFCSPLOWO2_01_FULL_47_25 TaxID=1802402 RepID=A0A1F7UY04_9BACT|nr:MAG: 50S ribosomal protein L13 [Parcubacteria group bacterium GW2011_GWA2_46_9]OGL61376.1 MAG: 50S ribosomal protein L13 [Candidatus Uhrbacteria bacterium RIFCSPHIGHO2_01_FULL_46_23]OGL70654.1 MAG: 50S ribosomal protein L13 [Candidatus Uhrbacteria bacterium RIFCSPHIGHO2_02_FULL_47_29]OGL76420.1 MAG: 50S ribosomal protein L13 [Candidatus Uhrbacteria bacterium RIFCSPHIGHO2_12_FULL_46_13]OGL83161.1 MAG: 50S ribosomal protein L13 [Candidatus Uhrbacteria bacterium RIFCSPLOWO2_01_FULL_47_25]OGL84